jgi:hypothetical protein
MFFMSSKSRARNAMLRNILLAGGVIIGALAVARYALHLF